MSAYRDSARATCTHRWASYWLPFGSGIEAAACIDCGARPSGWRGIAWMVGLWSPSVQLDGRPPEPPT